ncbi:OmpA family protein [Rhodopila sp.]|uniref:OmpA family protein n=1 Tax=Rhodopila sp. TaxID=2480087 RepID=UPI003D0DD745
MMKLRNVLVATTMIGAPLSVHAQAVNPPPVTGLYISLGAGGNYLQDEHLIGRGGNTSDAAFRSRIGPVVVGAVGYGLGNGIRLEFEGDYRQNRFSEGRNFGYPAAAGGNEIKYGPMFNVLYDLTGLIPFPYAAPYAGVGVGWQWGQFNSVHSYSSARYPLTNSDDTRGALAYQAIIGAVIPFQFLPNLATTIEYRFLGLADRNYDTAATIAPGVVVDGKQKFGNDFNHSLLIGLRYNFGAPPVAPPSAPSPVAAPAPAAARSYLVFFDWDKAALTDRARAIVKEAADNSTRVQYTRIEVNGYTDTSGTPKYNEGLSLRRGRTVAAELVRDGVPQSAINIQGFGETHLLVSTGPGVREPQNRRVEIIIR